MFAYDASKNLLDNKIILVTGAGSGIGRAAALSYARHGATVILLGKTISKLEKVYDEIVTRQGPTPAIIPLDLNGATEQNYQDLAQTIESQFGRLDGLLHNASLLGIPGPFEQISLSSLTQVLQVNLVAQVILTKALLPVLKQANFASIIFTTSNVGHKGRAFLGEYSISKFATEGMMQVLADECDQSSVRVNCINPGKIRTAMRAKAYPAEDPTTLKAPTEIMPAYLYLMGEDSIAVNGQRIHAEQNSL